MYTKIKNVQIIVSLLKQHGIRHLVLSAGTRHVPIIHSVENDSFFCCHSVVDERSAAYYALGLAKEYGEPVAIACTSSTATCNYTPAISEAFYQKIPLLILTGDRDARLLDQLEDQMINQVDMYKNFCKMCVNLPIVTNEMDEWYCTRLVNEAILELDHHGCGPVQINFQINQSLEDIADASAKELPLYNKIERVDMGSPDSKWKAAADELLSHKRIMVLCGSSTPVSNQEKSAMDLFGEKFNCAFVTEYISNVECKSSINAYVVAEAITPEMLVSTIAPDLVIFYGGNFVSRWKPLLRDNNKGFTSWVITSDGKVVDPFRNLQKVFECKLSDFFCKLAAYAEKSVNDRKLFGTLSSLKMEINDPELSEIISNVNAFKDGKQVPPNTLSAFGAMKALAGNLPDHPLVHLSILNSTRIMQCFKLPVDSSVYSNIGTDGIDGSMSTFLGQATANIGRPCFLVIGDLSFFYDMNSLGIREIGKNVHILLINNGGGAEFYLSMGPKRLPNIDLHVSAAHHHQAKEWALANGFRYMSSSTQMDFENKMQEFVAETDAPVLMEAFTDKQTDVRIYRGYKRLIRFSPQGSQQISQTVKEMPLVRQMLETRSGQMLKKIIKSGIPRKD